MGRGRQATASPEDHEESTRLNTKLQAYRARTSHIQTRLLTTLDTLDTLQTSFDEERKCMEKKLERLKMQLDECASSVKQVQAEKDDLQDAVLRLVEKSGLPAAVEAQDGQGPWPRSRMRLTSLAEPLPPRNLKPAHTDEEVLSFAASIIKSLRIERDFERDAHERTKVEYETRILTLEARIARLEAELEICVQEHTTPCHVETSPTQMRVSPRRSDEPITDDEAIEMLNSTVARNKALEMEIKSLVTRLEHARSGYADTGVNTSPPAYRPEPLVEMHASPSLPPPNLPHSDTSAKTPAESGNSPSHSARSSDTSVPTTSISEEHDLDEPTARSTSPHVHENRRHGSCDDTISVPVSAISPNATSPKNELRELDNQINEFAAQVDAFKYERDELTKVISSTKEELDDQCSPVSIEVPERLKIVEMECSRLRDSEESLRSDIEALQRSAQVRDEHLLEEIQALREQISALEQQTKKGLQNPNDGMNLLGDEGGERSMELETPLQPTSLLQDISQSPPLSPAHDGTLTGHRHPPSISLPPSPIIYPERASEPTIHRLSHLTSALETTEPPYAPSDASDANIERLAMELSVAQRRVQEGEDALNDLQTILEEFQSADG